MKPIEISDVELAFPASVSHLMPKWGDIPQQFRDDRTPWNKLVHRWFFHGLKNPSFHAKDGINAEMAWRHVSAIMHSFAPKHEHKTAAVAYLMSEWFEKVEEIPEADPAEKKEEA